MEALGVEWSTLGVGVLGFGLTWTMGVIKLTRAVSDIKADAAAKIDTSNRDFMAQLEALRAEFATEQREQEHSFGEVGLSMRQYVANLEKEMHQIEVWSRDNFVHKQEFTKATERLEAAIKLMAADIRSDFRSLNDKIDERSSHS